MIAGNKQVPVIFKEEEEEGEGQVKCIIAEVKKATEDAGIQTRAEMYAMLANVDK